MGCGLFSQYGYPHLPVFPFRLLSFILNVATRSLLNITDNLLLRIEKQISMNQSFSSWMNIVLYWQVWYTFLVLEKTRPRSLNFKCVSFQNTNFYLKYHHFLSTNQPWNKNVQLGHVFHVLYPSLLIWKNVPLPRSVVATSVFESWVKWHGDRDG